MKKIQKKLLALLLVAAMLVGLVPTATFAEAAQNTAPPSEQTELEENQDTDLSGIQTNSQDGNQLTTVILQDFEQYNATDSTYAAATDVDLLAEQATDLSWNTDKQYLLVVEGTFDQSSSLDDRKVTVTLPAGLKYVSYPGMDNGEISADTGLAAIDGSESTRTLDGYVPFNQAITYTYSSGSLTYTASESAQSFRFQVAVQPITNMLSRNDGMGTVKLDEPIKVTVGSGTEQETCESGTITLWKPWTVSYFYALQNQEKYVYDDTEFLVRTSMADAVYPISLQGFSLDFYFPAGITVEKVQIPNIANPSDSTLAKTYSLNTTADGYIISGITTEADGRQKVTVTLDKKVTSMHSSYMGILPYFVCRAEEDHGFTDGQEIPYDFSITPTFYDGSTETITGSMSMNYSETLKKITVSTTLAGSDQYNWTAAGRNDYAVTFGTMNLRDSGKEKLGPITIRYDWSSAVGATVDGFRFTYYYLEDTLSGVRVGIKGANGSVRTETINVDALYSDSSSHFRTSGAVGFGEYCNLQPGEECVWVEIDIPELISGDTAGAQTINLVGHFTTKDDVDTEIVYKIYDSEAYKENPDVEPQWASGTLAVKALTDTMKAAIHGRLTTTSSAPKDIQVGETTSFDFTLQSSPAYYNGSSTMLSYPTLYLAEPTGTTLENLVLKNPLTDETLAYTLDKENPVAYTDQGWPIYKVMLAAPYQTGGYERDSVVPCELRISWDLKTTLATPPMVVDSVDLIYIHNDWLNEQSGQAKWEADDQAYPAVLNTTFVGTDDRQFSITGVPNVVIAGEIHMDGENEWYTYDSDNKTATTAVFQPGSTGQIRLTARNNLTNITDVTLYVPIPKEGLDFGDKYGDAYDFNMYLAEDALGEASTDGWTISYGVLDEEDAKGGMGDEAIAQPDATFSENPSDISKVNMIKLTFENLAPAETAQVILNIVADEDADSGAFNLFKPFGVASDATTVALCDLLAAETQNGVISGTVFQDENHNGVKDAGETTGVEGLWVYATTTIDGEKIERSTQTSADGSYRFRGLFQNATYTIEVRTDKPTDPSQDGAMRFSPADDITIASNLQTATRMVMLGNDDSAKIEAQNFGMITPSTVTFTVEDDKGSVAPTSVKAFVKN